MSPSYRYAKGRCQPLKTETGHSHPFRHPGPAPEALRGSDSACACLVPGRPARVAACCRHSGSRRADAFRCIRMACM